MQLNRKIMPQEEKLLVMLVNKASIKLSPNWKENLLVRPMPDGAMGSLYLFPEGVINIQRLFGKQVSEYHFIDEDGVKVIASLNVDDKGELLELDIWKTDFRPLLKIPEI